MDAVLPPLIVIAGIGQLGVLIAAAMVPSQLNWRRDLQKLSTLNRQMHWVYGGYVVLSIAAFSALSIVNARELASGSGLARGVCAYIALFWGIRLALQAVFDVRTHLTAWWLTAGYVTLTVLFAAFTIVYAWASLSGASAAMR